MVRKYIKKDLYFEPYVPTSDLQAYQKYRHLGLSSFIYDKYDLSKYLNYSCGIPDNSTYIPIKFPVIIKPRRNLHGMGILACTINNQKEYTKWYQQHNYDFTEFMCIDYYTGDHFSTDLVLVEGEIKFSATFWGKKYSNRQFDYWVLIKNHPINTKIRELVNDFFNGFTGIINYEEIDNKIIEVHLRMGDIYHLPHISSSIDRLYRCNQWTYNQPFRSTCLFTHFYQSREIHYLKKNRIITDRVLENFLYRAKYYQFTESYMNMDCLRMVMFKCYNFNEGRMMQKKLKKYIDDHLQKAGTITK